MLKKIDIKKRKGVPIILLGIVVFTLFLISNAAQRSVTVEAMAADEGTTVSEMVGPMGQAGLNTADAASAVWISCTPVNVAVFDNRVHVKCAASVGGIQYFAKSTADDDEAARVLSILSIAQATGRTLSIRYDPADTSGASIGCQTNDCRLILAVALL